MNKIFRFLPTISFLIMLSSFNFSYAQQAPKLIIRSDDIGSFSAANHAIIETYTNGITTAVELMVNCPWAPEAVQLLKAYPNLDVGVHLMITSEWESNKWRPLTDVKSLVDEYGYFYSFIYPNKDVPGAAIQEHQWNLNDIEKEFRAQIELAKKMLPRISHISTHMGCGYWDKSVHEMLIKLSKEYELPLELDYGLEMFPSLGVTKETKIEEKISAFLNKLDELKKDKVYIFVEHPSLDVSEMEYVGHEGYRNVRLDRSDVTKILTDKRIKEKIERLGIKLTDFKSLSAH